MNAVVVGFLGAICAVAVLGLAYVATRIEAAIRENTRAVKRAAKLLTGNRTADDLRKVGTELKRIGDLAEPMASRIEGLRGSVDSFYAVAVRNLSAGQAQGQERFDDMEGHVYGGRGQDRPSPGGMSERSFVAGLDDAETLPDNMIGV